jgi:uncharacterized protein (DUF849 family)
MRKSKKIIMTCAVTGSVHTPSMSPYLPITPDQITAEAIAAAEAGAAMIHFHVRDPETGKPTQDTKLFGQVLPRVKQQSNAILNITTGGGLGMTMEERLAPSLWAKPEVSTMSMGSMNFNVAGVAEKITEWKYDWEQPYIEMTKDFITSNTFAQIERGMRELGDLGTRFEFECYDVGHLYNLAYMVDKGFVKPPFFVQGVFGILGGIGPAPQNVQFMMDTAERLFGDDYLFSVLAAGRHQIPLTTFGALLGSSVRVGLEDSLFISRGQLATSNAEQVAKSRRILEELGLELATPDEARAMLETKGGDNVGF